MLHAVPCVAMAALLLAGGAQAAECSVASGARRAALVELYTSEGCSSCPPADRQLSRLGAAADTGATAIALHVDYWDYIGWKDPYARAGFTARQRMLVAANGRRTLYTPHFFVDGQEVGNRGRLDAVLRERAARPAEASIRIRAAHAADGSLEIAASADTVRTGGWPALYVAVTESGLATEVRAGENRGATLLHDHVVREWFGPLALGAGKAAFARSVALTATQARKGVNVVAFVQDGRTGEVLQSAATGACRAA